MVSSDEKFHEDKEASAGNAKREIGSGVAKSDKEMGSGDEVVRCES